MRRPSKIAVIISLGIIVTLANAGFTAYSFHSKVATVSQANILPKASLHVKSAKQKDIAADSQGVKAANGSYTVSTLTSSRVNQPDVAGSLILATYKPLHANFIIGTSDSSLFNAANLNNDWSASVVAKDSLWVPAECSAKPSLLLQGRYIFIDDGKTKPTDTYNSYLVYDFQKGTYNYFGGDNYTTKQAKQENIILATNENDKLVFYVDPTDASGPLSGNASFKHAVGNNAGYIIRRVVDPATMKYTDYHITYTVPAGVQYYYLAAELGANTQSPTINLSDDADSTNYSGQVSSNSVTFTKRADTAPTANPSSNSPPYDSDLEKQLNNTLTAALPMLSSGEKYQAENYTTNFAVTSLGGSSGNNFITATSRNGTQNETPVVIDKSGAAYPLTDKPIFNLDTFVPLGVY